MSAPSSTGVVSTPSRAIPIRLLAAIAFSAAAFAFIVLATAAAGYGRDLHALRIIAVVGVILPAAVLLVWPNRRMATRVGAALFALVVGMVLWWRVPNWSGGMNLLVAGAKRDALKMQMASSEFDTIKSAGAIHRGARELADEYPKLAAGLQPKIDRWAASAVDAIAERYAQAPVDDPRVAREVRGRTQTLVEVFPEHRDRLARELHSWVQRAAEFRSGELTGTPLQDWAGFDRMAGNRLALVRIFPESRGTLAAAERIWLIKSTAHATADSLHVMKANPTLAREWCRELDAQILNLKSVDGSPNRFLHAREALFAIANEAARFEILNLIREEQYGPAFTLALKHQLAWLPVARLSGGPAEARLRELTEQCRHLSIRFDRAGFVEAAPGPREREIAPPPRSRSHRDNLYPHVSLGVEARFAVCSDEAVEATDDPVVPASDAAAERKLLTEALGLIDKGSYLFAVARLAPLVESRSLPPEIVKSIPGMIDDLRRLDGVARLSAAKLDEQLPAVAQDVLPQAAKRAHLGVELLQTFAVVLDSPASHSAETDAMMARNASKLLDSIAEVFGPEAASRLRIEFSARLFLAGQSTAANDLLDGETPNEHAREVLADLRSIILGEGTLANPQVARFVSPKELKELPGIVPFVPTDRLDSWRTPRAPQEKETTLWKLTKRARMGLARESEAERERLRAGVKAAAEKIQASLAKPGLRN